MDIPYFETTAIASKVYDRLLQPVCSRWNLTRNELDTLLFLGNNPGRDRAADIVRGRGMAKSHVSLAVRTLEERGMLLRQTDPRDRRNTRLKLTAQGEAVAAEGRDIQKSFFEDAFRGLSRDDLDRWQGIVRVVSRNICQMEEGKNHGA